MALERGMGCVGLKSWFRSGGGRSAAEDPKALLLIRTGAS